VESGSEDWDMMNVLSACVTVAAAAIADAGIDCVDTVSGGVAALVTDGDDPSGEPTIVLDPAPNEHGKILAACCVAYLPNRDEITNLWLKGEVAATDSNIYRRLVAEAVHASRGTNRAIADSLGESLTSV
jgi:exosome complex component MTR3